jgi:hypothetical protein
MRQGIHFQSPISYFSFAKADIGIMHAT